MLEIHSNPRPPIHWKFFTLLLILPPSPKSVLVATATIAAFFSGKKSGGRLAICTSWALSPFLRTKTVFTLSGQANFLVCYVHEFLFFRLFSLEIACPEPVQEKIGRTFFCNKTQ